MHTLVRETGQALLADIWQVVRKAQSINREERDLSCGKRFNAPLRQDNSKGICVQGLHLPWCLEQTLERGQNS